MAEIQVEDLEHGEESESGESEEELRITAVIDRQVENGQLLFLVRLASGEEDWYDRSDLYDFGPNTMYMNQYDKQHPIQWDKECEFCGVEFSLRSAGCEECRCDECGSACRHLSGVNYGCTKHPVI